MTETPNKPISSTQQRNMEALLDQDIWDLRKEAERILKAEREAEIAKARADWYAVNPQFNTFRKKVERYEKAVFKRLAELQQEIEGLGGRVHYQSTLNIQCLKDFEIPSLTIKLKEVDDRCGKRRHQLQTALDNLASERHRQILLATLGEAKAILTIPSAEDFLKDLD